MDSGEQEATGETSTKDASSPRRAIFVNALSSYLRLVLEALLFVVLTPFIVHTVGVEEFGLWSLVWAIVGLLYLLDLGFGPAVTKFVADARGKNDPDAHQRAVTTLFWIYVVQGMAVQGIVLFCAFNIEWLLGIRADQADSATIALLALGTGVAAGLPLAMFRGVFLGHQKQRYINFYEILGTIGYFGLAFALLPLFPDIRWLAIMQAGTAFVAHVALVIHAQRTLEHVSLHPRHFDRSLIRSLTSFSFFFMIVAISGFIATRVDVLVIQWAFDTDALEKIALYSVAMRLTGRAAQIGVQLSETITPVVAEMHGAGADDELRRVWLRSSKFGIAIAAPLMVGLAVLGEPLIASWIQEFNSEQTAQAAATLRILIAAGCVVVVHSISYSLLSMRGKQRQLAFTTLFGQILNLGLSVVLARPYGLVGIAMATLLAVLIQDSLIIMSQVTKQQQVSRLHFYRRALLPSVLPVTVMGLAMWGFGLVYPITHLLEVAIIELVGIGLFWGLFWYIGFNRDERHYVAAVLRRKLGRKS